MHQKRYATEILKKIHMVDCNSVQTPVDYGIKLEMQGSDKIIDATLYERTVGSLRFLCSSKSDIAYGVGWISRMYGSCKISSLLAPKRILRYAKGTLGYGLLFSTHDRNISDEVFGYCDSDWSGEKSNRKSTGDL